jgi:hypothetical protein
MNQIQRDSRQLSRQISGHRYSREVHALTQELAAIRNGERGIDEDETKVLCREVLALVDRQLGLLAQAESVLERADSLFRSFDAYKA